MPWLIESGLTAALLRKPLSLLLCGPGWPRMPRPTEAMSVGRFQHVEGTPCHTRRDDSSNDANIKDGPRHCDLAHWPQLNATGQVLQAVDEVLVLFNPPGRHQAVMLRGLC